MHKANSVSEDSILAVLAASLISSLFFLIRDSFFGF